MKKLDPKRHPQAQNYADRRLLKRGQPASGYKAPRLSRKPPLVRFGSLPLNLGSAVLHLWLFSPCLMEDKTAKTESIGLLGENISFVAIFPDQTAFGSQRQDSGQAVFCNGRPPRFIHERDQTILFD